MASRICFGLWRGVGMYVPSAKELVEVAGQPGLFLVLWVIREAKRVDLMALQDEAYAVPDVQCAKIRPYQDEEFESA